MPIQIGRQIGKGAEATVHEVVGHPDVAAKVYLTLHPKVALRHFGGKVVDTLPTGTKLDAMIRHNRAGGLSDVYRSHVSIAWPQQVVRCADGRVGYTMYYARGTQPLFKIYNPKVVAQKGWNVDLRFRQNVAYNIAVTMSSIHDRGYVIGDLNESNILVTSRAMVTFVDTDSFQLTTNGGIYLCTKFKWEYLAPELAGKDLHSERRSHAHDNFGLGVLIFRLLMNGWLPFTGVWPREAGEPPPFEEWISRGLFSYGRACFVGGRRIEPPPDAATYFDRLPRSVRDCFVRCFVVGHQDPSQRPSAREWARLLRHFLERRRPPIPDKPKIVSVANPNAGTSARLIFERPRAVADDQIVGYDYQKRLSGRLWSEAPPPTRVASRRTQYTFTGLARQSTYVFRVRAYNGSGTGVWSDDSPEQFIPAAPIAPPTKPALTRGDGSCRVTWANVSSATGYDLRWRQRGAWVHVPNAISPRKIAPLVNSERVDVQVRAKNKTGASAWSPMGWRAGTPDVRPVRPRPTPPPPHARPLLNKIVFGVALVAIIIIFVLPSVMPDRASDSMPSIARTDSHGETGGTASPEDSGSTAAGDDNDGAASQRSNRNAAPNIEPRTSATDLTFPLIESLERSAPSAYRTNADSVTWRITFTEAVRNVDKADFVIIGIQPWSLTLTKVNDAGSVYEITLNSDALADHSGTVALALSPSRTIEDLAGNDLVNRSLSGEVEFVIDNTGPRITYEPGNQSIDDGLRNLTLTFTSAVYSDSSRTPFTMLTLAGLIEIRKNDENGDAIAFTASIDEDNDTVTIDPIGRLPSRSWVRVNNTYYDSAGHRGEGATVTVDASAQTATTDSGEHGEKPLGEAAGFDTTPPTVTIDGVPPTDSGSFMATFTFSEEVAGFTESDLRVTNATTSAFTEVQAGRQWHVRITPIGDYGVGGRDAIPPGIEVNHYVVWLPANRVTDVAGNGNTASARHTGSYGTDVTDPRLLSIVRQTPAISPARADLITWRVTFSEDVRYFRTSSVNLLADQSDQVIRRSADRVSAVGGSESVYDVTFGGLADYTGRVRLNFQVRSDDTTYSAYIQDKSARALRCCETIGTDERTFDMDSAPAATERRRGSYGDVSTLPSSEPELDTALGQRGP